MLWLESMEADGFIKIWQAFNGIQLMIDIYDCLWLLSFLDIVNYWFVIAPHKYQHVGGKEIQHILWSESPKPLFLFLAQHVSKYIFSYMDHNEDFQDMVSVLFKSRQGANVTVISHANYTWKHRVSFIGAVTWLKMWLENVIKNWLHGNMFKVHPWSLSATCRIQFQFSSKPKRPANQLNFGFAINRVHSASKEVDN